MKLLLDTHLLLWAAGCPEKLSIAAQEYIENPQNTLFFSAASLWEVTIKCRFGRTGFVVEPRVLRAA